MPEEPRAKRPRFQLTGLEGPEELWERLRESTAEVETLIARNSELAAEVDLLRRRLRGVGELSDDELAAELPARMTRSLAAAREVADDVIERARNDAMLIRLNADQVAAQLLDGAKAESARIVRGTMAESQTQISTARARANELVRAAETQRSQILADLDDRSSRVEQERQSLHDHRRHLDHAYEQVAKALSDARAALATGAEPPPAADAARPERPPAGQRRPENPAPADRPAANRGPTERAAGGVRRGDGGAGGDTRREGVFDWSGGAVPSDDPRPKPAGRPAPGRAPYADADAVAG